MHELGQLAIHWLQHKAAARVAAALRKSPHLLECCSFHKLLLSKLPQLHVSSHDCSSITVYQRTNERDKRKGLKTIGRRPRSSKSDETLNPDPCLHYSSCSWWLRLKSYYGKGKRDPYLEDLPIAQAPAPPKLKP